MRTIIENDVWERGHLPIKGVLGGEYIQSILPKKDMHQS